MVPGLVGWLVSISVVVLDERKSLAKTAKSVGRSNGYESEMI
jgi:hypothetical protein